MGVGESHQQRSRCGNTSVLVVCYLKWRTAPIQPWIRWRWQSCSEGSTATSADQRSGIPGGSDTRNGMIRTAKNCRMACCKSSSKALDGEGEAMSPCDAPQVLTIHTHIFWLHILRCSRITKPSMFMDVTVWRAASVYKNITKPCCQCSEHVQSARASGPSLSLVSCKLGTAMILGQADLCDLSPLAMHLAFGLLGFAQRPSGGHGSGTVSPLAVWT